MFFYGYRLYISYKICLVYFLIPIFGTYCSYIYIYWYKLYNIYIYKNQGIIYVLKIKNKK